MTTTCKQRSFFDRLKATTAQTVRYGYFSNRTIGLRIVTMKYVRTFLVSSRFVVCHTYTRQEVTNKVFGDQQYAKSSQAATVMGCGRKKRRGVAKGCHTSNVDIFLDIFQTFFL